MTLKSQILAIKTAKVGDTVSYDRTYAAQKDTPVATVPIGYVHGVSRTRSGKGHAIIGGRTANLLGRVCMNLTMYDVSQIAVLPGQEAVLLGRQGGEVVTAYQLAEWEDTSVYEVLCLAGRLNPRVFVEH